MCQGVKADGSACRANAEPFCHAHKPETKGGPNATAFAVLSEGLPPSPVLVLGATLATELDRQVAARDGVNAALVGRYSDILEGLVNVEDEQPADRGQRMLADVRNIKDARTA